VLEHGAAAWTHPSGDQIVDASHHTTALQAFRKAGTQAIISENWLLAAPLERPGSRPSSMVLDDGSRTPDELAAACAVVAPHRTCRLGLHGSALVRPGWSCILGCFV
jgi:hypothetical protein